MSAHTGWPEWPTQLDAATMDALCREFDAGLPALGVVNFTARELWRVNQRHKGECELQIPPRQMWPNIHKTLQLAQKIRHEWGAPVAVLCGYRHPAYNRRVGGAEKSEHMQFAAVDLAPAKLGPGREWHDWVALVTKHVDACPDFCGFGIYQSSRFTHIDVGARQHSARWTKP